MHRLPHSSKRSTGLALVLVLVFLVLLSVLLIAFFTNVQTDLQGARSYSSGVTVKQLSETTVNLVMSQITDGTRTFEEPGNPQSTRLTWASQPGLIRTYQDNGSIGRAFKLFSSGQMVTTPGTDYRPSDAATLRTEIPENWPALRALYTDLNEPILVNDPLGQIDLSGGKATANYPIVDPLALLDADGGTQGVEGFKIQTVPGYSGKWTPSPKHNPTISTSENFTANPAPMPVQWIYVLANGCLTAPFKVSADGMTADWSNLAESSPNKPSQKNPIVGRIAFWTDDETCKLNINTASEGVFWDRSWANSTVPESPYGESQLRDRLPVSFECQRYPGHPATICLSPVFASLNPSLLRFPKSDLLSRAQHDTFLKRYYNFTPRIGVGGTFGGTLETGRSGDVPTPMVLDQNRLYSSVDELIFGPPDGVDSKTIPSATATRTPLVDPDTKQPLLKRTSLERARFFLTAYNRAPEVNVFGRPRLSLWMLQQERDPNAGKASDDTGYRPKVCPTRARNARDELLAYCSTAGKFPFYFQRSSIFLGTVVNGRKDTKKPFGQLPQYGYTQPSSQHTTLDWNVPNVPNVQPRNPVLYEYLQSLTSEKIPGWGGRLTDKYPAPVRNQLLTEMVDLLRSGTNGYAQSNTAASPDLRYEYAPARRMPDATMGETQIVPLVPPDNSIARDTKGFGRFPTITEAALIFYRSDTAPASGGAATPSMRALLVLEPFTPTAGSWTWSPLLRYVVKGLDKIKLTSPLIAGNKAAAVFRPELVNLITSRCGYGSGGAHNTAFTGIFTAFRHWNTGARLVSPSDGSNDYAKKIPLNGNPGDPELSYNFVSDPIPLTGPLTGTTNDKFNFAVEGKTDGSTDGEITVEIHSGYAESPGPDTLVQTIRLAFPAAGWPLPKVPDDPAAMNFQNRIGNNKWNLISTVTINKVVYSADTVRSLEVDPNGPTRGDLRLVSALKVVPPGYFAGYAGTATDPGYLHPNAENVQSLRNGNGGFVYNSKVHGDLFDGTGGTPTTSPGNPVTARGLKRASMRIGSLAGDFDNGPWDFPDGAYINKPDDYYSSFGGGDRFIADTVTPNRQVPSPTIFGSLPVNVQSNSPEPWRTLLFCRNPAAGDQHPGLTQPRDHLLLDFFTMPIVEPYAISEPFSTAGKVNLNFEIAPFSYLRRDTALRGVLKSTRLMAIPNGTTFKSSSATIYRKPIDPDATLDGFVTRFQTTTPSGSYSGERGAFRTASEICDMHLVPDGVSLAALKDGSFWKVNAPTGDNVREFPYGTIYSRVTTKSNVFTVHMRVQVLKNHASANPADYTVWNEKRDQVLAEHRGSSMIERYIDPTDPTLPDFADFKNHPEATMDDYYKFRILSTKKFLP